MDTDYVLASFCFGEVWRDNGALPDIKLSPFAFDKGFQALIPGRLRSIKRLRNGAFLVECAIDRPMKVSTHSFAPVI